MKRRLIRKKSGEVVKPTLHNSSPTFNAPGTPKTVHFNNDLEQIQPFFQTDRTISISVDSSPVHYNEKKRIRLFIHSDTTIHHERPVEWTTGQWYGRAIVQWSMFVTLLNSRSRYRHPLQFENLHLSTDRQSLIGAVAVANIAFEKQVTARFTIDDWQTISEVTAKVTAEYRWTQNPTNAYDQFRFIIELPAQASLHTMTLLFCIQYAVNGQEYWDNNSSENCHVNLTRNMPLQRLRASDEYDGPRSYLNGRSSDRYNITTSLLHTTTTLFAVPYALSELKESRSTLALHLRQWYLIG
ncbi:carbohydrate-binding module family 21 protein [Lepidopterella palustris CBS 459.81]|uniref:Carbohydrate-binding module family 21 protein n=1 Tax=Lepidopterella palustris CBS 459.81 TaxID=1314670 RepID=A0A8E2JEG6_9PEZI|nr:carbohydrate-binding module family 21 protein [Lepidopterella palustris CBS 459.81]